MKAKDVIKLIEKEGWVFEKANWKPQNIQASDKKGNCGYPRTWEERHKTRNAKFNPETGRPKIKALVAFIKQKNSK